MYRHLKSDEYFRNSIEVFLYHTTLSALNTILIFIQKPFKIYFRMCSKMSTSKCQNVTSSSCISWQKYILHSRSKFMIVYSITYNVFVSTLTPHLNKLKNKPLIGKTCFYWHKFIVMLLCRLWLQCTVQSWKSQLKPFHWSVRTCVLQGIYLRKYFFLYIITYQFQN